MALTLHFWRYILHILHCHRSNWSLHDDDDYDELKDDETQNGHNLANFEVTTSWFGLVIDLNDTYRIMMTMMKTQNGHNSANFEAMFSRY